MKLLSVWKKLLKVLKIIVHMMSQNIATHWNSIFVMLNFTLKYCEAIDKFTSDYSMDVRSFELDKKKWELAKQLRNVLKVHHSYVLSFF